eukprot:6741504-Pyramimonas_sp.AAC.1
MGCARVARSYMGYAHCGNLPADKMRDDSCERARWATSTDGIDGASRRARAREHCSWSRIASD